MNATGRKRRNESEERIDGEDSITTKVAKVQPTATTSVCNVKVEHIRPEYKNLKDWCEDSGNLYIGRAGVVFVNGERFPKKQSIWANPFKLGRDGNLSVILKKFQQHICDKIRNDPVTYNIEELRNRNLGCWCVPSLVTLNSSAPMVCHGQVLLQMLSEKGA
eukprot:gene37194-45148_t